MDLWQRRAVLAPAPNPDRNIDFVSSLSGRLAALGGSIDVALRYVPDALTVSPTAFAAYLRALEGGRSIRFWSRTASRNGTTRPFWHICIQFDRTSAIHPAVRAALRRADWRR